jgi:hypothetical protein
MEDSQRETRRRIWRLARGMGIDPRDLHENLRIESKKKFWFSDRKDIDAMRRTIETWKPDLIGIDSLSRTHQGDENSVKEMQIVTLNWSALCQEYGVAVAIIHHMTKSGDGSLLQKIRGTGDLTAVVRHAVGIEKLEDDIASLEFDGNLPGMAPAFNIKFSDFKNDQGQECIGIDYLGSRAEAINERIRQDVLAYVYSAASLPGGGSHGVSANQIRENVVGRGANVDAQRDHLVTTGQIVFDGKRYYRGKILSDDP